MKIDNRTKVMIEGRNVATLDNALLWGTTQEKFTFCIDLLEMSAHDGGADYWVDRLEESFLQILADYSRQIQATIN